MKIIAHCTDKYLPMYEAFFKASAPASFDITFKADDPFFREHTFVSDRAFCLAFSNYIWQNLIQEIEDHIGQVIVYTGVDLQFFADVSSELTALIAGQDVLFFGDWGGTKCPEFMTIRCSQAVADGLRGVVRQFNLPGAENDMLVLSGMHLPFRHALLPRTYWNIGWCTMRGVPIEVPGDIRVHHANYVIGFDQKMEILASVREKAAKKGVRWASEQERG